MKGPLLFAAMLLGAAACSSPATQPTALSPAPSRPALTQAEADRVAISAALWASLDNPASYQAGTCTMDGTLSRSDTASFRTGHPYRGADSLVVAARRYQVAYRATNAFGALVKQEITAFVYLDGRVGFL